MLSGQVEVLCVRGCGGGLEAEPSKDTGLDLPFTQTRCREAGRICREQFLASRPAERSKGPTLAGASGGSWSQSAPPTQGPAPSAEVGSQGPSAGAAASPLRAAAAPKGIDLRCDEPELLLQGSSRGRPEGAEEAPRPTLEATRVATAPSPAPAIRAPAARPCGHRDVRSGCCREPPASRPHRRGKSQTQPSGSPSARNHRPHHTATKLCPESPCEGVQGQWLLPGLRTWGW